MTYKQAIKDTKAGKKVTRRGWEPGLFITNENGYVVMNDPIKDKPNLFNQWLYTPTEEDIKKRDWEILEEIGTWR